MRPPIEEEIEAAEVEVDDGQQTAVMLVSTRLAGNAVIRVVNRCNDAQESQNLGKCTAMREIGEVHHRRYHVVSVVTARYTKHVGRQ